MSFRFQREGFGKVMKDESLRIVRLILCCGSG
jgi:hypothetical protein